MLASAILLLHQAIDVAVFQFPFDAATRSHYVRAQMRLLETFCNPFRKQICFRSGVAECVSDISYVYTRSKWQASTVTKLFSKCSMY